MPEGQELSGLEVEQAFSVLSSIDVGALSMGAGASTLGAGVPILTTAHSVSPAGTLEAAAMAFASVASGRTGEAHLALAGCPGLACNALLVQCCGASCCALLHRDLSLAQLGSSLNLLACPCHGRREPGRILPQPAQRAGARELLQPRRCARQSARRGIPCRQHRRQHTGVQQQQRPALCSATRQPAAGALSGFHRQLAPGRLCSAAAAGDCGPRPAALPGAPTPALARRAGAARPCGVRHPSRPPGKPRCTAGHVELPEAPLGGSRESAAGAQQRAHLACGGCLTALPTAGAPHISIAVLSFTLPTAHSPCLQDLKKAAIELMAAVERMSVEGVACLVGALPPILRLAELPPLQMEDALDSWLHSGRTLLLQVRGAVAQAGMGGGKAAG